MERYTLKTWWKDQEGLAWFGVYQAYADIYPWYKPARYRFYGLIPEFWYYLKCLVWKRYNTVTAKTLPPTWRDADSRMLHINFEILRSVIEDEQIFERNGAEGDPNDGKSWAWALKEMQTLWHWWTVERPARVKLEEDTLHAWAERRGPLQFKEIPGTNLSEMLPGNQDEETERLWKLHNTVEAENDAQDEAMLIRLIKLRPYLWT